METIYSPKCWFELVQHGTKSQKTFLHRELFLMKFDICVFLLKFTLTYQVWLKIGMQ
jgi:hypothetical protein